MAVMRRCGGCRLEKGPRNDQIQPKLGFLSDSEEKLGCSPVKYALRAISLGVNGDSAGRSQNLVILDIYRIR